MKRAVLASLLIVASISAAFPAKRSSINISDETRTKISADVAKQKPTSQTTKWKRGRKIEDNAELLDVPADWGKDLTKYKYFYTGERVWFIEPESRRAIDVIKVTR
jgi:Protein of unknown function (DUF1236).